MLSRTSMALEVIFTVSVLVGADEGDGLEPAAQETPQRVGPLLDHVVGREDDVGVEILLDVAEVDQDAALLQLLQLEAARRIRSPWRRGRRAPWRRAAPASSRAASTCMPSRPQPCWRDSSRLSQSVSEPPVVTPMRLPLRSATVLIGDFASTTTARFDGAPYIAATPIAGTPLARKPRPGPEPSDDVDRAGGEAGLHLRVALEARNRELDAFLLEDAGLHADVGRGEGPGVGNRLADAELVLRQRWTTRACKQRQATQRPTFNPISGITEPLRSSAAGAHASRVILRGL